MCVADCYKFTVLAYYCKNTRRNIIAPQSHSRVRKKSILLKNHQKCSQFFGHFWAAMSMNNYVRETFGP